MREKARRTASYKGTAREVGLAAGRRMGTRLEKNIDYYLRNRPLPPDDLSKARLQTEALEAVRALPPRFQDELEGLAEGAGVPFQKAAEWVAIEQFIESGCSGLVTIIDGQAWVARNNDFRAPALWGYAAVKNIKGRIPTINFGMEGDIFTCTGINREQLWLHMQYMPQPDKPRKNKRPLPGYVLLTEVLETCATISEVEKLLKSTDRLTGMALFAVEGKTNKAVILECACRKYERICPKDGRLLATNHAHNKRPPKTHGNSAGRLARLKELAGKNGWKGANTPGDLIAILADDKVECRIKEFTTVEAAVACPAQKKIWYTFGGYPAASAGNWRQMEWPW